MTEPLNLEDKVFLLSIIGMLGSANILGYGLAKGDLINIIGGLGLSIMFAVGNSSMYGEKRRKLHSLSKQNSEDQ